VTIGSSKKIESLSNYINNSKKKDKESLKRETLNHKQAERERERE